MTRSISGTAENKLFVASMNRLAAAQEIHDIFAPYGFLEDVFLMRDAMKQSRGCGFVKLATRHQATAAMNDLDGNYVMRTRKHGYDQPLIVRFAETKRSRPGESSCDGRATVVIYEETADVLFGLISLTCHLEVSIFEVYKFHLQMVGTRREALY